MLEPGQPAPDFEILDEQRRPVKLSDFRGKRVVIYFYPKADTPGCTRQSCGFRDNYDQVEAANAVVLGVSPDQPEDLAKWKSAMNFPFSLLSDPDHEVAEMYGAWGERNMYGRKYMGIIRSHVVIDEEGFLEDVQNKVSPENSVSRALETLKATH